MRGTLAQLVAAIPGARLTADATYQSVSTDSRSAGAGALFVALRGETFDAHDFLAQVAAGGAAAVVVDSLPQGWTLPAIVVPDTLVALGRIAHHWRAQFDVPVIGVTGSNGKTTVKEMIAAILAAGLSIDARLATRGNLNNEIGVPLTLMRLTAAHKAAVIELGMNHPGEIARLTAIATPTIGLVNNAQREHQEFMHTVEAVARENGAVLAGLPADGVAVFPGDDEYSALWQGMAAGRRTITFGFDTASNVSCVHRATDFGSELDVSVRLDGAPLRTFNVKLAAAGLHNVRNALAAIACAMAAGVTPDIVARGLAAFEPVSGRLQRKQAVCGATVIDDTYNANPDSVRAAIDVLAQAGQPRILVLGDMGEVGTQGREFHEEIGAYAATRGIKTVLVTGELTRHMAAAGAQHYTQFDELLAALDTQLGSKSDATVLVKGSRFMKMERVVQHLVGSHNTSKEAH
ncbi:UDP-N-acetylmuramoyl-tripeptide--D-alanyl-D-alanine ligase [Massilia sp. P8910]|uniref:UDP-N-acetylmuramoyl-tripeptide--D-alanyl-D- alanine ligase n=1 Tax=Massilia antarctica TaxID=2765360 RepID=UPI001E5EF012|nr:UDP-N-acetylmuramoyl-tripeptide--D-alanyl-D-alanine ligase [Massilia antarctica]MCE3603394.1 UDP-N-acetylmuramoyl-tripeptide--D-alanyl-D-alanine ligase [Massilia antarctica]